MAQNEQPRYLTRVKIPMHADYLMDYFLSRNGKLMRRQDNDEVLALFIEKNSLTEEYRKSLLLEIDHCLYQLHRQNLAWPELSPTEVLIMISEENATNSTKGNISALANIYCFVLSDGKITESTELSESNSLNCTDPYIALDLIKHMKGENFSIEDVLRHPFHWSDHKKITFVCHAFDLLKGGESAKRYGIEKKGVLPDAGWVNELILTEKEREEIDQIQDQQPETQSSSKVMVREDIIFDEAKRYRYDPKSIYDLMRFFRNFHAHYWENSKNFHFAFGSYLSGYWRFYSRKYPKLFMHVYRTMNTDMRDNEPVVSYTLH